MEPIRVGLVADPAAPTAIARGMTDLRPLDGSDAWDITVISEPFTTGSEDVETAVRRLQDQARQRNWDLVVGLTELPLHDHEGRHLLVETDPAQRTAQEVLAIDSRFARAQNLLGAIYATRGDTAAARKAFQASLLLDPQDPATYQNLAQLELNSGHAPAAAQLFTEALTLDPTSAPAREGLSRARSAN